MAKDPDNYTSKELQALVDASPEPIRTYCQRSRDYFEAVQRHISSVRHVDREPSDIDSGLAAGYTRRAEQVLVLVLVGEYPRSGWERWIYTMPQYGTSIRPSAETRQKLVDGVKAILRKFPVPS